MIQTVTTFSPSLARIIARFVREELGRMGIAPRTIKGRWVRAPRAGLVTVTGNATGGGVYTGYVRRPVKQKFDPTRSGTLNSDSVNQFGEPPSDTSEIYILNAAEEGTDTHALTDAGADVSKTHVGYLLSMPATDGKPVWVINGFAAQTCTPSS